MIKRLSGMGISSDMAYIGAAASVLLSIALWFTRRGADQAHAERFGIFVGLWAPTLAILARAIEETERHEASSSDEDMVVLLVRAIGGEADKLAMLQRSEQDLRELHLLYQVGQSLAMNLDLKSLLQEIQERVPEALVGEAAEEALDFAVFPRDENLAGVEDR